MMEIRIIQYTEGGEYEPFLDVDQVVFSHFAGCSKTCRPAMLRHFRLIASLHGYEVRVVGERAKEDTEE
jgi:hypothetical protein